MKMKNWIGGGGGLSLVSLRYCSVPASVPAQSAVNRCLRHGQMVRRYDWCNDRRRIDIDALFGDNASYLALLDKAGFVRGVRRRERDLEAAVAQMQGRV